MVFSPVDSDAIDGWRIQLLKEKGTTGSTLKRLLNDNERFDFAGRGTVNHLPMALYALSRIEATDERLKDYFRWWEENRASPRRYSGCRINRRDWPQYVGQAAKFDALSATFREWIAERGSEEVIEAVFPALSDGMRLAAFHGLISLAYGVEVDHAGEIAAGLAGLCARYDDLGLPAYQPAPCQGAGAAFSRLAEALGSRPVTSLVEAETSPIRASLGKGSPSQCERRKLKISHSAVAPQMT